MPQFVIPPATFVFMPMPREMDAKPMVIAESMVPAPIMCALDLRLVAIALIRVNVSVVRIVRQEPVLPKSKVELLA